MYAVLTMFTFVLFFIKRNYITIFIVLFIRLQCNQYTLPVYTRQLNISNVFNRFAHATCGILSENLRLVASAKRLKTSELFRWRGMTPKDSIDVIMFSRKKKHIFLQQWNLLEEIMDRLLIYTRISVVDTLVAITTV